MRVRVDRFRLSSCDSHFMNLQPDYGTKISSLRTHTVYALPVHVNSSTGLGTVTKVSSKWQRCLWVSWNLILNLCFREPFPGSSLPSEAALSFRFNRCCMNTGCCLPDSKTTVNPGKGTKSFLWKVDTWGNLAFFFKGQSSLNWLCLFVSYSNLWPNNSAIHQTLAGLH